jgi:hypothetical protein
LETNAQPVAPPRIRMSSQLVWLQTSRVCRRIGEPASLTRAPTIHAAAARKRGGHGERRRMSLVAI